MNGVAHTALGAASGFVVANALQTEPASTLLLVALAGVSGLIPDLDIDGRLSNKITVSTKTIRTVAHLIGFLMIIYSYVQGVGEEKWIGMAIGLGMMVISSLITQRRMLTVTGIGVFAGGLFLQENWLILLAVYIVIASFVPHRSYTHSILGVIFFGVIAYQFEASIGMEGVFISCLSGYASHLIADMKSLPFNKRGVKLFLPFSSKEF